MRIFPDLEKLGSRCRAGGPTLTPHTAHTKRQRAGGYRIPCLFRRCWDMGHGTLPKLSTATLGTTLSSKGISAPCEKSHP